MHPLFPLSLILQQKTSVRVLTGERFFVDLRKVKVKA
jgi:hypothetical protein